MLKINFSLELDLDSVHIHMDALGHTPTPLSSIKGFFQNEAKSL